MSDRSRSRRDATSAVHGPARTSGATSTPLDRSATFSFPSVEAMQQEQGKRAAGAFYQRLGHPTIHACERRLAALEGAEQALLFASGVAAITAVFFAKLRPGDHVVAIRQCYGGTSEALRWGADRLGWSYDLVDAREPETWAGAFRETTRLFHLETPTNPTLNVVDLARAAGLAHAHRALLSVDNTFASPMGQHPLELGADLALYSATKSIGGHSDLLAGVAAGSPQSLEGLWDVRTVFGAMPDPSVAWLIERSLKTLPLRVERANANALELAKRLASHPRVAHVFYPGLEAHPGHEIARRQMIRGFGPVLAFEVRGTLDDAERAVNGFELIRNAPSLGSVESLASLPIKTSHRQLNAGERAQAGLPDALVRVSVGVEDVEDLWADLNQALDRLDG